MSIRRTALARCLTVLFAILPLDANLASPVPASDMQSTAIRAFISRVYKPYLRPPVPFREEQGWYNRGIISQSLLRLVRLDQKRAGADMVGYIDADPICACQDYGQFSYRILNVRQSATRHFVTLRLHDWGAIHTMTLVLLSDGRGGFVIDDISDENYQPSFKVWLTGALRSGPVH